MYDRLSLRARVGGEDDGRWTVAPCANLTEGITSLVNGCPSYDPGLTTAAMPARFAPSRARDGFPKSFVINAGLCV